jgi:hypothetical protein
MARKQRRSDGDRYWNPITLLMPCNFASAATEAAHMYRMPATEYCRRALLLRLEADGVRLDDFSEVAA